MPDDTKNAETEPAARTGPAALVIGSLTILSRILGLIRDMLFAVTFFGAALDAFALAFTVPNLFRRLFGEGALASSLVPAFVAKLEAGDRKGAALLAARALGALIVGLGAITLLIVLVAAAVAFVFGTDGKVGLIAGILAIVMPYVILICGAAVLMAFLNATKHFAAPALAPVLLNVSLIAAAVLSGSIWWLAVAVLVGGVLQYVAQAIPAARRGMQLMPRIEFADSDLRKVGKRLAPTLAGLAAFQINVILDRIIAEVMIPGDGAVGSLFLGNRLMQLPLAVFAIAIATSALPELSALVAKKDEDGLAKSLRRSAGSILFWTVPSAVGLALLAEPLVGLLFDRGAFLNTPGALPRTGLAVMFYAPGLIAFGLAGLYARAFYARGEPKRVVAASMWAVAANLILNILLVTVFQHVSLRPGVELSVRSGEAGLALASSASGIVYLAMLVSAMKGESRRTGALRSLAALAAGTVAALVSELAIDSNPVSQIWTWLWNVPSIPVSICVGTLAALAIALCSSDSKMWPPLRRTALASVGMGVATNLVLSSLPVDGESYVIVVQRAIAPVVLGAGAYWFFAGLVAGPEYDSARTTLSTVLFRHRKTKAPKSGAEDKTDAK